MPRELTQKEKDTITTIQKVVGFSLNDSQMELALPSEKPKVCSAGPGSGKTTALGYSVTYKELLDGIPAKRIFVMTFTNKATNEFKHRHATIMSKLGLNSFVGVSTIHAFCKHFVNLYKGDLGLMEFKVLDDEDGGETAFDVLKNVYKNIMNLRDNQVVVKDVQNLENCFSFLTNRLIFTKEETVRTQQFLDLNMDYAKFEEIRTIYRATQRRNEKFSFDEIMMLMYELLRKHEDVRQAIQSRIEALFVDEFQDTTPLQLEIIRLAKSETCSLTVVGDPNQSIYRWRGAFRVFEAFKQIYPDHEHAKIETNYRCPEFAVIASNALIRNNDGSNDFQVKGTGKKGKLEIIGVTSNHMASLEIARMILTDYEKSGRDNNVLMDKLVLYRNHSQAMFLVYELAKNKVPLNTHGLVLPHKDKIARDIFAICNMLSNPRDSEKASKNLHMVITQLNKTKNTETCPYFNSDEKTHFAQVPVHVRNVQEYESEMKMLVKASEMLIKDEPVRKVFQIILPMYMKAYYSKFNLANLMGKTEEDVRAIENFLLNGLDESYSLDQFRFVCSQVENFVRDSKQDDIGVKLLTIHSAKGLEAKEVYLLDMNNKIQPNAKTIDNLKKLGAYEALQEHILEERSLAYVAITRTLHSLYVTYNVENPSPFNLESGLNIDKKAIKNVLSLEKLGIKLQNRGENNMNQQHPNQQPIQPSVNQTPNTLDAGEQDALSMLLNSSRTSQEQAMQDILNISASFANTANSIKEREVKQTGFNFGD